MIVSKIRRMRWRWQLALWPLYAAAWIACHAALMALQLAVMAKKVPAPLFALMPAIAAAAAALGIASGNVLFAKILGPVMAVWLISAVAYLAVRAIAHRLKP
jgi:hypothetical protein